MSIGAPGLYTVLMETRRWSHIPAWLPFAKEQICFQKETTWEQAYNMAHSAAERGAFNVQVFAGEPDRRVTLYGRLLSAIGLGS